MTRETIYKDILADIAKIFDELYKIIKTIKDEFVKENKQHPALTIEIVNYHLDIVKKYRDSYQNNDLDTRWTLEKNIKYTKEDLRGFYREFENPFFGSQKWYQKINGLMSQLSENARSLDLILQQNNE